MHESEIRDLIAHELRQHKVADPEHVAASLFMTLTTKAAVGDANVLRWCEWPGCLRSFHVMTGPRPDVDGVGWIYVRSAGHVLFCPDHADLGHRPQRPEWEPGWDYVHVSCECGAREENWRPANLDATNAWWRGHVLEATRALAGAGAPTEPSWVEPDDGPDTGHTWRIEITSRTSSIVTGDAHHHDAPQFDGPMRAAVRAWSLPAALEAAAGLPLFVWVPPEPGDDTTREG